MATMSPSAGRIVTPDDVTGTAVELATRLLGMHVVRHFSDGSVIHARIVETEAYRQSDPASHSARGQMPRNASMFAPAGTAYVYQSYGVHWCLNCVAEPVGTGAGVLLRAAEVIKGHDAVRSARPNVRHDRKLLCGPGCLAAGLRVDGPGFDGVSFLDSRSALQLMIPREWPIETSNLTSGPRVGVSQAVDTPWRFWIQSHPSVSHYRRPRLTKP